MKNHHLLPLFSLVVLSCSLVDCKSGGTPSAVQSIPDSQCIANARTQHDVAVLLAKKVFDVDTAACDSNLKGGHESSIPYCKKAAEEFRDNKVAKAQLALSHAMTECAK